ncbi:MAG: YkvA family protein [Hansschlegelia sp.]
MALEGAYANFERVKRDFWPTLRRVARSVPFAEDAVAAYYCAFDRETPFHVRATLVAALAYFILPFDAVPDFIPIAGFVDDAGVLAAAIASIRMHMTDKHRDAARRALAEEGLV